MTRVDGQGLYARSPADADILAMAGTTTRVLCPAHVSGGRLSVMHQILAPGMVARAHRHANEDQIVIVLDGQIAVWVEGEAACELGHNGLAFRPRGRLHALWNTADQPTTILEITTPGESFERWMLDLSGLNERGGATQAEVGSAAARYGITFAGPDEPDPTRDLGHDGAEAFGHGS